MTLDLPSAVSGLQPYRLAPSADRADCRVYGVLCLGGFHDSVRLGAVVNMTAGASSTIRDQEKQ